MPQPYFLHARETIRAVAETRRACTDFTRRALGDFAETRAGSLKAIAESRELMAKIDIILASPWAGR